MRCLHDLDELVVVADSFDEYLQMLIATGMISNCSFAGKLLLFKISVADENRTYGDSL